MTVSLNLGDGEARDLALLLTDEAGREWDCLADVAFTYRENASHITFKNLLDIRDERGVQIHPSDAMLATLRANVDDNQDLADEILRQGWEAEYAATEFQRRGR